MDFSNWDIWNTCMGFPSFSRGACASWVQAWGSVGAIVGAVYIASRADREAKRHAISNARTFAGLASGAIEGMLEAIEAGNRPELALRSATLRVALSHGDRIRLEHLPLPSIAAVAALQSLGVQATEAIELYREKWRGVPSMITGSQAIQVLQHCVKAAEEHCVVLGSRHKGDG